MGNVNQAMKPSDMPPGELSKAKASTNASPHAINVADVVKAELLKKKPDVFRHSLPNQPPTRDSLLSLRLRTNSNKSPASPSDSKPKTTKTDNPSCPQVRPLEKFQSTDRKPAINPCQPSSNDQIVKRILSEDGTAATLQSSKAPVRPTTKKRNEKMTVNAAPKGRSTPRPAVYISKQSTNHSAERPNWAMAPSNPPNAIPSQAKNDAQVKPTPKETGHPKQETTQRNAMTVMTKNSPAQSRIKKTNATVTTTKAKDGHLTAQRSGKPSIPSPRKASSPVEKPSQSSAPIASHSSDSPNWALAFDTTRRGQDPSRAATPVPFSKEASQTEHKDKQPFLRDKTNAQAASGISRETSNTSAESRHDSPRRLAINKNASARFIKAALSSNSKDTKKQQPSTVSYAEVQARLLQAAHSASSSASLSKDCARAAPDARVSSADASASSDASDTLTAKGQTTTAINAQVDSPSRSPLLPERSESISASLKLNALSSNNHCDQPDTCSETLKTRSISAECIPSVLEIHSSPRVLYETRATSCCESQSTDVQANVNIPITNETSVISVTHKFNEASTSEDPLVKGAEGNSSRGKDTSPDASGLSSVSFPSLLSRDAEKNDPKPSDPQTQDLSAERSRVLDERDSIFSSWRRRDAVRPVKISVNAAAKADMASWLAGPSIPPTPIKAAEAKSEMAEPTSVKLDKVKMPIHECVLTPFPSAPKTSTDSPATGAGIPCTMDKCEVTGLCDASEKECQDFEAPGSAAARNEAFVTPIKQIVRLTTESRAASSRKSGFWDREDIVQPLSGTPDKGWYAHCDVPAAMAEESVSKIPEKDVFAFHNRSEHISEKHGVQRVRDSESQLVDSLLSSNSADAIYSSTPVPPIPRKN